MGAREDLVNIEEFEKVYLCRWNDFKILKKEHRKSMCMHLGGIVIECLLKSLLVKKYDIEKSKKLNWYNKKTVEDLLNMNNITKKEYTNRITIKNPEHNLQEAIENIAEINNVLPKNISEKIISISKPIKKDNKEYSYIDLRYFNDDDIAEEEFEEWLSGFKDSYKWLNEHKSIIKEVE